MEPVQAAVFAKQLFSEGVVTVGTFLGIPHATINVKVAMQVLSLTCIASLDGCLQQFAGLPENRHAAPGTAVATRLLRVVGATALAHPIGVVCFCCAFHAIACANVR